MGFGGIGLNMLEETGRHCVEESDWLERQRRHEAYVLPFIDAYRDRRARHTTHPVHDFLFTYYQTNRQVLKRWRPCSRMVLSGAAADVFLEDDRYLRDECGVRLNLEALDEGSLRRIRWVDTLISAACRRPIQVNCFGLHEWAMVYKATEIRHEKIPLRVSSEELERIVESSSIRCSHFDAVRFFTPEAAPLNELSPGRDDREHHEQFGCVHFNMDLYRWSYKLSPWVGSDLIRDCFALALRARELDMCASPYDLSQHGYMPILIETGEGREQYRLEQKALYEAGQPLARRLLDECAFLLS